MIEDRVGELRLRVRTNLPDPSEARPAAERIVRAVLERCAALLEARAPGRLVLLRRLPLRWRLTAADLDDPAELEAFALIVADLIERSAIPMGLDPPPPGIDAVLFDDEAHLRASHLLAYARAGPAWVHAALEEDDTGGPLVALARPRNRATALAALTRLARSEELVEALAAQPPAMVALLAASLGLDTVARGSGAVSLPESARSAAGTLTALAATWPVLLPAGRLLALYVHAAVLLDADIDSLETAEVAAAAKQLVQPAAPSPPEPALDLAPATGYATSEAPQTEGAPVHPEAEPPAVAAPWVTTQFAGLLYLLNRVQELDLAEALWRVCLPEGAVLAAAASALLGPDGASDPAAALFGGVAQIACPDVTADQHAEVATTTCAALAAALPRRGLADIPPVVVALAEHPAGRLLIAAAEGSPFVFFAWPATTPDSLRAGLLALLGAWSHRGIMRAAPALAALDVTARLRPAVDAAPAVWLLPSAPSATGAALLALVAGAPCTLLAARAGPPFPESLAAFVRHRLRRRARIATGPDRIDLLLSVDDVDLDLRRAGLDRDPGWIPWLRRTVTFVFEESPFARQSSGGAL